MTTLKQSLAIDGQAISNLDPELVITLDAHPSVQISNKTESTITYSFIGAVTKDATYTLNLTFVYKGIHKLVMPLTFEQTVNDPILKVTNIPKSVKIWDEGSDIPFTVFYGPEPGEDITESISDVVITANDSIEGLGGPKWRVKGASSAGPTVRDTQYAFNVTHGDDTFAIKALATFNIAQWDGVLFKVEPITFPLECTVGMDTVIYFKPTYMGKYEKGARISPIDGVNRRGITIVKQEDDDENERLAVTIRGASAGMQFYNQFIFLRGAPGGYSSVQWMYVDVYAKAVTATVSPARTDTKLGDISKLDITNIRIGHEKVDLLDPRVKFSSSSNNSFSRLSVEKDKAWFYNNNSSGFVNVSIYIDATGYTQFSKVVPMYTIAGTTTGNTLNVKDSSEVLPAQHNVQTFTLVDGQISLNRPAPAGLKLIGKLDVVINGNKPVLKLYDDFALTDTPVTGSGSFSMDNGHSGNNITLGGLFEDATGKQWALRNAVFQIPQSPMLMSQVVPGPIDAPNTDQQVINMKVEQLQFDKQLVQLDNVLFGGMSVSGEASAIGTITSKGDGTYLIPITPTGNSGDAVIKGQITYEGVVYAFTSTITFKDVADVKIVDKPLNVKVFDVGSDVPFTVMVDGVDKTQEITNLKFTPTANVIAYNDLGAWEIWDAPTAGVTEKIKYTFDLLVEGVTKSMTFDASFVIGAWDGAFLKVKNLSPYIGVSSTGNKTTYTELEVTYRNKPAADKIQFYSGKPANMGIYALEPSDDKKTVRVPMYYSVIAGYSKSTITLQWRYKGTTGTVIGRDIATGGAQDLYVTDDNLYGWNIAGSIQGNVGALVYSAPNLSENPQTPMIFANGEKIPNDSPDLEHWLSPGADTTICASFLGVVNDRFVYKITAPRPSSGSIHNLVRLRLKSNNRYTFAPTAPEGNFRSYPFAGTVDMKLAVVPQEPIVPAKKNIVPVKLVAVNQGVPATPTVYMTGVYKNPSNGNVVIDGEPLTFENTADPTVQTLTISTGHTGDKVNLRGIVNTVSGLYELNHDLVIGKSEVTAEPWQDTYTAKADVPVDVVFDLNMMHYDQVEASLSQIVFKTINITGNANGTTLPVNVAANAFKTPITIPGLSGTTSITGTFTEKDAPSIEYGFAFTVTTKKEAAITTEPSQLKVNVWDVGTKVPFVVKADGTDVTSQVEVIEFTPTTHVVKRTVGTDPAAYLITSDAEFAGVTETVNYKYRLPGDAADVVREASGDFVIGAYDGVEFQGYVDSGTIWNSGVFFVFQNTSGNQAEKLYVKGKYRGEEVNISHLSVAPMAPTGGPLRMSVTGPASAMTLEYSGIAYAGTGPVMIDISVYRTGQPGNTEGKDKSSFRVPCSVYNNSNYVIVDKNTTLTGKKGQEMEVYCKVTAGRTVVKLDNPEHKVVSNKANIEFIPGSMTPFGFKVRFTDDVEITVNNNVQFTISNAGSSVAGYWNTAHLPSMDLLELSADFVTAIEGDSRNTVTVKQSTILPTE